MNIGRVVVDGSPMQEFLVKSEDLKKHVFVSGMTGTGKTTFVQNFMNEWRQVHPNVPFLLMEIKGEYAAFASKQEGITIYRPGINLCFSAFGDGQEPRMHAERMYNILESSFHFDKHKDFSPQMEKILVDVLHFTACQQDPSKRTFQTFFEYAKQYVKENKHLIPYIESSWIAIENRLRKITTGPLQSVFNDPEKQVPFETMYTSNCIISMGDLVKQGASKEDIYFISNMVLKHIFDTNLAAGPSNAARHLTILEDAQYFERKSRDTSHVGSSYFEDFALLLRGTGEIFFSVSTRPSLSSDVLANAGMIVTFQTKLKEDVERLQSLLHLDNASVHIIEILPEFTCMVKVNSLQDPFLLKVENRYEDSHSRFVMPGARVLSRDAMKKLDIDVDMMDPMIRIASMIKEFHALDHELWVLDQAVESTRRDRLQETVLRKRDMINSSLADSTMKTIFKKKRKIISKTFHVPIKLIDVFLETT